MDWEKSKSYSHRTMNKINKLKEKIKKLEDENEKLKQEKHKIEDEKHKIEDEKRKLEKEFEEFKAQHIVTVNNLREAMKIKADFHKKKKHLGAPKGHRGYSRHVPERIDCIQELKISKCPDCNTKLGNTQEVRTRCITDIKLINTYENTQYNIHRKYCPKCKKIVEPEVPNTLPHARFGLNLMLFIMYLKIGLRLPCNKICDYFRNCYELSISSGEITNILQMLTRGFGDYYIYLEKIVKLAKVKHTDSTSWRINGKNYFAWAFVTCGVVIYKIKKRNNSKVPISIFGIKQEGNYLVIDRHSALRALAEKCGFLLQLCWSHILSDSKELSEAFGKEGKYIHRRLKEVYALAKGLNHRGSKSQVEQLKAEILQLTLKHYLHPTIRRFVNNLYYRDIENLFRFVTNPNIDSTNNISERELRELVITRKISNGSRSKNGAEATATLLSVIQTLRLNNKNILVGMRDILNNPSGY